MKMYLSLLSTEEKHLFLKIAYTLSHADGVYSDEEQMAINEYCKEMNISFDDNITIEPLDRILDDLDIATDHRNKKIIIFELIGLALAEGDYSESEKDYINAIEKRLDVDHKFSECCEEELRKYIDFQVNLNRMILE